MPQTNPTAQPPSVVILDAPFYTDIAAGLLTGVTTVLDAAGIKHKRIEVPGILELPAALLLASNAAPEDTPQGYVLLGCAIKGETDHYEHVCHQAMTGIQQVTLARSLAVGNGILTCPTKSLALARSDPAGKDHGGQAARACLRMLELAGEFGHARGLDQSNR